MSNVKKIKVGGTSYDCKDATARTQVGRINLTKSGDNLLFTDSNGTQHSISIPSSITSLRFFTYWETDSSPVVVYDLITGHTFNGSETFGDVVFTRVGNEDFTINNNGVQFHFRGYPNAPDISNGTFTGFYSSISGDSRVNFHYRENTTSVPRCPSYLFKLNK